MRSWRSFGQYSSLADSGHGVYLRLSAYKTRSLLQFSSVSNLVSTSAGTHSRKIREHFVNSLILLELIN
jgi:hypothetical protein